MKLKTTIAIMAALPFAAFSKTFVVKNSGLTFSPSTITITEGDSVSFELGGSHNAREVSEGTFANNGSTALAEGFETAFGGGLVLPGKLTVGTHYYVCAPHAGAGMKGTIIVERNVTTDVADQYLATEQLAYPNPANEQVHLDVNTAMMGQAYALKNAQGIELLTGTIAQAQLTLDIANLPKGMYIISLGNDKKQNLKFIKE